MSEREQRWLANMEKERNEQVDRADEAERLLTVAAARVEELAAALHIIAPRLEERATPRDRRLAEIARAALAGREEPGGG